VRVPAARIDPGRRPLAWGGMTFRRSLLLLATLPLAPLVLAAPAGAAVVQTGEMANGSWTLLAERQTLNDTKGVCLTLQATFADGSTPGTGTGCGYGSLRVGGNILPVTVTSGSGDVKTTSLVGGIVVRRARTVRVAFTDGKRMTLRTKRPPTGLRTLLRARVRSFGGDALGVTTANVMRVVGYDARGRRVARSHA
jgi:hypothetical protein